MKIFILYSLLAGVILASNVALANNDTEKKMIMTLQLSGSVCFVLDGIGSAKIDWGDGTTSVVDTLKKRKTIEIGIEGDAKLYKQEVLNTLCHVYSDKTLRTITITGSNITYLDCNNTWLMSLDVSQNTELVELNCQTNKFKSLKLGKTEPLWTKSP